MKIDSEETPRNSQCTSYSYKGIYIVYLIYFLYIL